MATKRTRRTKNTIGRAAVGITIIALVGVGLLGYRAAAGTGNNTHYRTVTATAGTVTQVLALSGTVHHVTQSSVSFPTSGMVTAVNVKAGDTVAAGQALASINATPLQNAVLAADAAYKSAISQYQTDQQTYASSTSSSTTKAATSSAARPSTSATSSSPVASGAPSGGGAGGPGGGGGTSDPTAAVKAATDAIAALQAGVTTVETQLPIFVTDCIPLMSPTATVTETVTEKPTATVTVTVTETPTASASVTGVAVTAASATKAASSAASSATTSAMPKASTTSILNVSANAVISTKCQAAMDALTEINKTLPGLMGKANDAVNALAAEAASLQQQAATLAKQQQAAQAAAASAAAAAAKQQSSNLSSSNSALQAAAAAGLSRSGGSTVTAATLITDQSTIETTRITLATAQDQLNQATITSPIAGKVASMPFVVGQQASATASAVIIGSGAIEVTVPVPLAKRTQVATGQAATVTSTIGGTTLQGTITRINLLPTTTTGFSAAAAGTGSAATGSAAGGASSQSTTTYGTVITIPSGGELLPELSRVGATITTKTVNAAVVLPASAVTPTGTGSGSVQVVTNGVLSTKRVVTGALGESLIEIVSGVTVGESVVIADVDKAIPGASIAASRGAQTAAQQQQQQPQEFPTGGGVPTGNGGGAAPSGAPPT